MPAPRVERGRRHHSTGAGGTGKLVPATSLYIVEDGLVIDSLDIEPLEVVDVTSDRPPPRPRR